MQVSPSAQQAVTPSALVALFDREYEPMVRLAYVMLRSAEDAEEVVQDAFADVQARWSRLVNPGGYLRTCVVNGARQRMGREQRRPGLELSAVDGRLVATDEHHFLTDALERLSERQRVALIMAYFGGYSSQQIAETLDCPVGTAKSLVHRGLAALRKELGE